jgi:cell division protein FtsZ
MAEKQNTQFSPVQDIFIPNIKIIGVGGAGGNVVTQMAEENLDQVETIICNTDIKALKRNKSHKKIELGRKLTRGMGAGARPEVGEGAAEESILEISEAVDGANMVFIAAGMGGGTGTGAAPTIARMAMEKQILTVGIVTIPFSFEGTKRRDSGLAGVERLREFTDTLLVIPNDKLLDASTQNTSFLEAFHMVDMVLINAIRGITLLLSGVGDINVDFADVQTIMKGMGKAVIGRGTAKGKDRAINAVEDALHGSLMEDTDIRGAKGILVHVNGPKDTSAYEIQEAMSLIEDMADEDVELIWGATFTESAGDEVAMTVIATGLV